MRNLYLLLAAALFCAVACTKENVGGEDGGNDTPSTNTPAPVEPNVTLKEGVNISELDATSNKAHITFDADRAWKIECLTADGEAVNWIRPNKQSGNAGKHTIDFDINTNNSLDSRMVQIVVRDKNYTSTRGDKEDMEALLAGQQATLFAFSLIQYGHYELKYGDPIELTVTDDVRLKTLVNDYIAEHNLDYSDMEYLELFGPLVADDFKFMREKLTNLTVLDLTAADVYEIPRTACLQMKSLHYIKLPFKLERIGENAFYGSGLKNINMIMPPMVRFVGGGAFQDTNISGSIIFLGTVPEISLGMYAFYGNGSSITSAIFGEGISKIDLAVGTPFSNNFTGTIYLPHTLTYVGSAITNGKPLIYCYAPSAPKVDDEYGINYSGILGLLIPAGSFFAYTGATWNETLEIWEYEEGYYPWRRCWHEDKTLNKLHYVL